MAVEANAYTLAAVSQTPEPFRAMLLDIFGRRPGICTPTSWAVTQTGSPSMGVVVAAGSGLVAGSESTLQGGYLCRSTSNTTITITAANPTNPRWDIIVARIRDNEYATGPTSAFTLEVVNGTPAASPAEPAKPANSIVLARVTVGAGVTSITNANIIDWRTAYTGQQRAAAIGGITVCTSNTRPAIGNVAGSFAWESDTKRLIVYNGSAWEGASNTATATVATSQTTASGAWVDLATPGPAVSVVTGTKAVVWVHARVDNGSSGGWALMSPAVSGATTIAASDIGLGYQSPSGGNFHKGAAMITFDALTPGLNTFTAKYSAGIGTATFVDRRIAVTPAI